MTHIRAFFQAQFDTEAQVVASAPGRVNIIGEHTDYNDGFVMPTPLPQQTQVAIAKNGSDTLRAVSSLHPRRVTRIMNQPRAGSWTDYVLGSIVTAMPGSMQGLDIAVMSDVPQGASVSSSAALEVAVLRAINALFDLNFDDVAIAQLGQKAENTYVGLQCGLMDQMVSSAGEFGKAQFFDTRTLEIQNLNLPSKAKLVTIHSGQTRELVGNEYNERREACEAASAALGVKALRDVGLDQVTQLQDPLQLRRARHVVSENQRVLEAKAALQAQDEKVLGALMTESHWSLSRDFETSTPRIDAMVTSLLKAGALGARITGAGFGGCLVALTTDPKAAISAAQSIDASAWVVAEL